MTAPWPTPPSTPKRRSRPGSAISASRTSACRSTRSPALTAQIREGGASSYLEVVSLDRDSEIRSVKAAIELGVDYLLGGTHADDVLPLMEGTAIRYYPFPGRISGIRAFSKAAGRDRGVGARDRRAGRRPRPRPAGLPLGRGRPGADRRGVQGGGGQAGDRGRLDRRCGADKGSQAGRSGGLHHRHRGA